MRAQPLSLVGGAYTDDARPWSLQDTCNYLPCSAERAGTRSPDKLRTPPGLRPLAEVVTMVATGGDPAMVPDYTPGRGIHVAEGRLFAVIGRTMYRISNAGVAIPLGTIPGIGRVAMDHNQISLGNEVVAVNGSAGYTYNTVTDSFARITDTGFPGALVMRFIDGFMVGVEPQGRFAFNSAPANAREYNTLDRFTSEVKPDKLVSLAVPNGELMLLSATSCEFFQNTGAAQQPFRSKRISLDKGCAGAYAVTEADSTVFWLGSNGSIYQLEGYAARRISTRAIEAAIRDLNWSQCFAHPWEDGGHTVAYFTFPDGHTWGYDVSEQEWHRRESYGLNRWRVNGTAKWLNRWVANDFQNGRLWGLDWAYPWEGDVEFISSRTLGVIHDNQSRMLHKRLELVMDTGMPYVEPVPFAAQPEGPDISGTPTNPTVGNAYSFSYTLADGTPPYVVTLRSGALPDGLSLSAAGVISGIPTVEGEFTWTARVTDTNGLWDEIENTVEVQPAVWAMVAGDADVLFSVGGLEWDGALDATGSGESLSYAAFGGSRLVTWGIGRSATTANAGASWTLSSALALGGYSSSRYGCYFPANGRFYVAGSVECGAYESSNGSTWTQRDAASYGTSVGCSNTLLIQAESTGAVLRISTDGTAWSDATGVPEVIDPSVIRFASNGTKILVAGKNFAGTKTVLTTTANGTAWTANQTPFALDDTLVTAATYDAVNGRFIVGAETGEIAYSADGLTWTLSDDDLGEKINDMHSSGGLTVLVGDGGEVWTSDDGGETWTDRGPSTFGAASLKAVCRAN